MGLLKFRADFCVSTESVRAQYANATNTFTSGFYPSATAFLLVASIYLVLATMPLTIGLRQQYSGSPHFLPLSRSMSDVATFSSLSIWLFW